MYTRFSISFSILLHLLYVHSVVTNKSINYLPFIMVKYKGQLELPNQLDKANFDETQGFTGDTQFSKNGSKDQKFFCPLASDEQQAVSKNCLFKKQFTKKEALKCDDDGIPFINQVILGKPGETEIQSCGPFYKGTLYKFLYKICFPVNAIQQWISGQTPFHYKHYTVYEICYNHDEKKPIYTKHTLKSVNLLYDRRLKHEKEKQHPMMTDDYGYFQGDFLNLQSSYDDEEVFVNLGGTRHSSNSDEYLAGKLVPPDDMLTALLRKPTFHFINIQPVHEKLKAMWDYIQELIRVDFINPNRKGEVGIYTAASTVQDPRFYLSGDWPDGVPQFWIKLVYEKFDSYIGNTLVIIMTNENKPEEEIFNRESILNELCENDYCAVFKQNEDALRIFGPLVKKIRCCSINHRINSIFFNLDLKYLEGILSIINLTVETRDVVVMRGLEPRVKISPY